MAFRLIPESTQVKNALRVSFRLYIWSSDFCVVLVTMSIVIASRGNKMQLYVGVGGSNSKGENMRPKNSISTTGFHFFILERVLQ